MLDMEMFEAAIDGWSEPGNVKDEWEHLIEDSQSKIQKKYKVIIEHEEDSIRISTW